MITINKIIRIELLSDLCTASGDGFAGVVDTDVYFDNFGLPYIPSKRLKGCLRECGLEIISVDESYSNIFNDIFGKIGQSTPGTLNIGNGMLANYYDIVKNIGNAHPSELAEIYTSTRSRTSIGKDSKAVDGSLRTFRTLNKGQTYEFPVSFILDECSKLAELPRNNHEEFLNMCVKSLRSMGLNRSRGLGEITCTLEDSLQASGTEFIPVNFGNQKAFSYTIKLLEPTISAHRSGKPFDCEEYIFGSTIMGIFASQYIKNNIEKNRQLRTEAHKDDIFRRVFLEGAVKFVAAMPYNNDKLYHPAPATLKTDKLGKRLLDDAGGIPEELDKDDPVCKRLNGFVFIENGTVARYNSAKVSYIHHARPANKTKGHSDEDDGEIYTYEALAEGQTFAGYVIGSEEDLSLLINLFAKDNIIRIGRSRTAQYGKAVITPAPMTTIPSIRTLRNGDTFRLVAVTPLILEDEKGVNTTNLSVISANLGKDFEIVRYACSETVVAGYNSKWLLPRGHERAIAEGSVIVLKYNGEYINLEVDFIGKRTGEGFGQVRIEDVPHSDMFSIQVDSKNQNSDETSMKNANAENTNLHPEAPEEILLLRASKKAIADGTAYGEHLVNPPQNANLQRIVTMLRESNTFADFTNKLCEIQQPEQKIAALVFATRKDKWYFKTNHVHLSQAHIVQLLELQNNSFEMYKKFLSAAILRIKQKRRNKASAKQETTNQNGGDNQ